MCLDPAALGAGQDRQGARRTGSIGLQLPDVLAALDTICRTVLRIGGAEQTFTRLIKMRPLQERAFELLGIRLVA